MEKETEAMARQTVRFLKSPFGEESVRRMKSMGLDNEFILRAAIQKANRELSADQIKAVYDRLQEAPKLRRKPKPRKKPVKRFTLFELQEQCGYSWCAIVTCIKRLFIGMPARRKIRFDAVLMTAIKNKLINGKKWRRRSRRRK